MELHLFSTPGKDDLRDVVEASRPYLEGKDEPVIAYLPLASLYTERWQRLNEEAFRDLGRLVEVNAERMTQREIENIIRDTALVYITGGNTFLLNHRLHVSGVMPYLKKKFQNGLPVVGVSAGMIVCGPNILTSRDMNTVETTYFNGLNASPFNYLAHYPLDDYGQSVIDDWLRDYHFFHDNPVIMVCDGAHVKMEGKKTFLAGGEAYILRKEQEKERLEEGKLINL
ncbi:MAG TPA: Type 1 glutamine amidotransferase-like domain-containing protein [Anaerolineales bacterium]|nr:Type 1 glutamine amidotransferase-like domain-containing protein [Anaerolineales bacterium]